MKHATPDHLAKLVSGVLKTSRLASIFDRVDVNAGDYDGESEFLRIVVHLRGLEKLHDDDVDLVTSSIEGAVAEQDDRFPSVRFSEP